MKRNIYGEIVEGFDSLAKESTLEDKLNHLTTLTHLREVAAKRLSDGYESPSIYLAFALDYWHDKFSDAKDYRQVWCGIVWC